MDWYNRILFSRSDRSNVRNVFRYTDVEARTRIMSV